MTAHINASPGDFARTVIMPGDPLRARFIAHNYLENCRQVCDVRNMLGFTGLYQGKAVSVMGHGMGIPSMALYAHELITDFSVKRIIRVGSIGATQSSLKMRDVILAMAAGTDSVTNKKMNNGYELAASATFSLLHQAYQTAMKMEIPVKIGNVFSGDLYYDPDKNLINTLEKGGVLGIDMEAAGLYSIAQQLAVEALAILTVSDHCISGEETSAEDRQQSFSQMITLALNVATQN